MIEPLQTLQEIMAWERFAIRSTTTLGPFGEDIDRVCYHLHEDLNDPESHSDATDVRRLLEERGVPMTTDALADYPYEIWERRWPTSKWVEHELPLIFEVLNEFGHGVYAITYEPMGAASDLYQAALRDAWNSAEKEMFPPGWEPEDLSGKYGGVVLGIRIADAVYGAVRAGTLTARDAAQRIDAIQPALAMRAPAKITPPSHARHIPQYDGSWEKLKEWAVERILTNTVRATLN